MVWGVYFLVLFGVLHVSWTLTGISSLRLEKYSSIILLKIWNLTFYLTEWSNSSVLSSRHDILSCIWSNFWWGFPLTFSFKFLNFHFEFYFILTFLQRFCLLNSLSIFGIIFIISFSCILQSSFYHLFIFYPISLVMFTIHIFKSLCILSSKLLCLETFPCRTNIGGELLY